MLWLLSLVWDLRAPSPLKVCKQLPGNSMAGSEGFSMFAAKTLYVQTVISPSVFAVREVTAAFSEGSCGTLPTGRTAVPSRSPTIVQSLIFEASKEQLTTSCRCGEKKKVSSFFPQNILE